MSKLIRISPCLWFDHQAEDAAALYTGLFPNSRIRQVTRYNQAGTHIHGKPAGSVLVVSFELDGQPFSALNGGPLFKFNEAVSLEVTCDTQEQIDYFWNGLSAGGDEAAQQCGWLKDRYGVSWQVTSPRLLDMLADHESPGAFRAMEALLEMKKPDLDLLERAYAG